MLASEKRRWRHLRQAYWRPSFATDDIRKNKKRGQEEKRKSETVLGGEDEEKMKEEEKRRKLSRRQEGGVEVQLDGSSWTSLGIRGE